VSSRALSTVTQRVCACGCNGVFRPTFPGSQFKRGHKPKKAAPAGAPIPPAEAERACLNYRLALQDAEKELRSVVDTIDSIDDEIEKHRDEIWRLQELKDGATARHAQMVAISDGLKAVLAAGPKVQVLREHPLRQA